MLKNKLIICHNNLDSNGVLVKIKRRFRLMIILLVVIGLSACKVFTCGNSGSSPTVIPENLIDRSWLTGDPCSPPCWYGLAPDSSSKKDVIDVITNLPFVTSTDIEFITIGYSDALSGESLIAERILIEKINDQIIRIVIGEDTLKQIDFGLNFEISIGEVTEILGLPDVVRMLPDFNSNYCEVEFHWLSKQLIVISEVSGTNWKEKCLDIEFGSTVDRNMQITQVSIIYQNWQTAMMNTGGALRWPGFSD